MRSASEKLDNLLPLLREIRRISTASRFIRASFRFGPFAGPICPRSGLGRKRSKPLPVSSEYLVTRLQLPNEYFSERHQPSNWQRMGIHFLVSSSLS